MCSANILTLPSLFPHWPRSATHFLRLHGCLAVSVAMLRFESCKAASQSLLGQGVHRCACQIHPISSVVDGDWSVLVVT
jgi:hypothetical protein